MEHDTLSSQSTRLRGTLAATPRRMDLDAPF